jgi:hypothetical protein
VSRTVSGDVTTRKMSTGATVTTRVGRDADGASRTSTTINHADGRIASREVTDRPGSKPGTAVRDVVNDATRGKTWTNTTTGADGRAVKPPVARTFSDRTHE